MVQKDYLETACVDVREEVPFGFARLVVSIKSQTGVVADRVGEDPRVVVFETDQHSRYHQIPDLGEHRCVLQEVIV